MSVAVCAASAAAGLLALALWLIAAPLRWYWKIPLNALCGFLAVALIDLLAGWTGVSFPLNWLTAAVPAALGLPGVGALLIVRRLLL